MRATRHETVSARMQRTDAQVAVRYVEYVRTQRTHTRRRERPRGRSKGWDGLV